MNILPPGFGQVVPYRIKNLLIRQRLTSLGRQILSHSITTVVAPAGYGKSVWVSSLLEEPFWPQTFWFNMERHDCEPSILFHNLLYSIKRVLPDFGTESLRTLASLDNLARDWPIFITVFLNEFPKNQETVLILDDFHVIQDNPLICTIIEKIIRCLPHSLHLILISRTKLPLNLYHQQLNGNLLEIQSHQLQFTLDEAKSLFDSMGLTLTISEAASIHEWTEGWAVGLRLAGICIKQSGEPPEKIIRDSAREGSSLYRYLGNELLDVLPEYLKDFLIDSSLLPFLEEELCNYTFQCSDSLNKLEELHQYGLLSKVDSQPVSWRIHHLLGAHLWDRAIKLRSKEYINKIRGLAGVFFENNGDIDRAIELAIVNSDFSRAANLIHKYSYDYYTSTARLDSLFKFIEQFPQSLVSGDQWLLYYKGKSMLQIDDIKAMSIFSAACDIASQQNDVKCEACCLLAMISSSVFSGDYKKGQEAGRRLMANSLLFSNPQSRGIALTAALWHAMYMDDLQQGTKLSRTALGLSLNPELRMNVLCMSSFINSRLGKLDIARELIEEALSMPYVQENERCLITCYTILILILNFSGDTTGYFEEICEKILYIGGKYSMSIHVGRVFLNRGYLDIRKGCFMDARRNLELTYDYFTEGGGISISIQAALLNMLPRIRTGEDAKELLKETRELLTRFEAFPYGQGIDYYVFTLGGIVAMEAGELELAHRWLEKSADRWRSNGARQNLAATNLLLSHVFLLQGNESKADFLLRRALGAAEAGQWTSFWEWNDETVYTMCRRAIINNIHARWAVCILQKWFPVKFRKQFGGLLIAEDKELVSIAASIFRDSALENGNTIIHAFFLGDFRLFVNGMEVDETEWKTQKAEKLIKLLLSSKRSFPKDELIELIWPGCEPHSGDASLRTTLNYIRKAFGVTSETVMLKRGKVFLNAEVEVYCDFELFESEASRAVYFSESDNAYAISALNQAISLYHGNFLSMDSYEDWANHIRTTLHRKHLELLQKLAYAYYERGSLEASLQTCSKYLTLDPADESIVRLAMLVLFKSGKKQKAIALYRELEVLLLKDYNIKPEKETLQLYLSIVGNRK